jgi:hypothetical protein
MANYGRDPYWLMARFASTCKCGAAIKKGERIFYYPSTKSALCPKCSEAASADFNACAQDDAFYNSGY